jgi:hypothetical protein
MDHFNFLKFSTLSLALCTIQIAQAQDLKSLFQKLKNKATEQNTSSDQASGANALASLNNQCSELTNGPTPYFAMKRGNIPKIISCEISPDQWGLERFPNVLNKIEEINNQYSESFKTINNSLENLSPGSIENCKVVNFAFKNICLGIKFFDFVEYKKIGIFPSNQKFLREKTKNYKFQPDNLNEWLTHCDVTSPRIIDDDQRGGMKNIKFQQNLPDQYSLVTCKEETTAFNRGVNVYYTFINERLAKIELKSLSTNGRTDENMSYDEFKQAVSAIQNKFSATTDQFGLITQKEKMDNSQEAAAYIWKNEKSDILYGMSIAREKRFYQFNLVIADSASFKILQDVQANYLASLKQSAAAARKPDF